MTKSFDDSLTSKLIDSEVSANTEVSTATSVEGKWDQSAILTLALCWALTL